MAQHYSNPKRESDPHALPDIETFYHDCRNSAEPCPMVQHDCDDGTTCPCAEYECTFGWYWHACFPGCLPDGEPNGPFETEAEALADAREGVETDDDDDDGDDDSGERFTAAYEHNTRGLTAISSGFAPSCSECLTNYGYRDSENDDGDVIETAEEIATRDYENGKVSDEGGFSWSACDTCGSSLGGNREYGHGLDSQNGLVHLSMCTDCVMFTANGDLPDSWGE